jgi:hypothetical protein
LQRDPIGYEGKDHNLMRYTRGNPVLFTDYKGLIPPPVAGCLAGALGAGIVSGALNLWNYLRGYKSGCEAAGDTFCDTATGCIAGAIVGAGGLGIGACIGVTSLSALLVAGCKSIVRSGCDWLRRHPGNCPRDPMNRECLVIDMLSAIGSSTLACIGGGSQENLIASLLGVDVALVNNIAC